MTDFKKEKQKSLRWHISHVGILVLGLFLLVASGAYAQNITVTGKVTDAKSHESIPGANVVVKGTTNGTITDPNGNYSLSVPANATLEFSFIGYKTQEVPVNGKKVIDIKLATSSTELDEVVAIGYGTVKKKDITGSVASVQGSDLQNIPVTTAAEAISGKLAGVQVTSTEGSPDAQINIRVRGGGSITQDNSPLFIVDGFPVNSISDIAPSDIQSIDVLKDASSTAIYGSRGANGVIIVTTKSGKKGKVSVSYNAYMGFSQIEKTLKTLNPEDYVNWQYEYAVLRYGGTTPDDLASYTRYFGSYQDIDQYKGKVGNNWQKQIFGRTGQTFHHDVSIRGGSEKFNYAFNYAHVNTKAIMMNSGFNRDYLALKLNHNPNKKVALSYSFRYSDTKIDGSGTNEQNEVSSADSRLKHSVVYTPVPLQGLASSASDDNVYSYLINPITATNDNDRKQYRKKYNMAGSFSWKPIDNLQFKSDVGLDIYDYTSDRFYGLTTYYVYNVPASDYQGQPAAMLENEKRQRLRNTNTVNYDFKKLLGEDHSLKVLVGEELLQTQNTTLTNVIQGYPKQFTSKEAFKLTTQGTPYTIDNYYSPDDKMLSFFGRLNYDYQNKYILSATFRADGSSKFSKANRWGYFPSAAFAWRISQEGFMEGTQSWLSDLKLRLSYGTAGNNNIPSGQLIQSFTSHNSAWIDQVSTYWSPSKTMANPDLKWETTYTRNIGLDFAMFDSRLNGSFEAYLNNTKDLLIRFPVAGTGYDYQYRNMGETQNKGLEFSVNWAALNKKNYGLNLSFNISFNRNKIKSLGVMDDFGESSGWASTDIGNDYWIAVGGSVGEMYGYVSDGRYTVSDFSGYDATSGQWILKDGVVDASEVVGTLAPGVMKLKNITGNDNVVNSEDRTIIGDANPKHTGGFTLNGRLYNFDLSAVFNWSYGNDIYNANKIEYTTASQRYQYRNMIDIMADGKRWTNIDKSTGQLVTDPATLETMNANTTMWSPYMRQYVFSDWAVEDGSFLRLSTLTLGYTLPSNLTNRFNINSLRFYVTGYNVLLLTNYSGFDPEVSTRRKTPLTPGVDYSAYPRSRQIVFGLNLNF